MVDWSGALTVATAGFLNVFLVLALLMVAMRGIGALLAKIAQRQHGPKS